MKIGNYEYPTCPKCGSVAIGQCIYSMSVQWYNLNGLKLTDPLPDKICNTCQHTWNSKVTLQ